MGSGIGMSESYSHLEGKCMYNQNVLEEEATLVGETRAFKYR